MIVKNSTYYLEESYYEQCSGENTGSSESQHPSNKGKIRWVAPFRWPMQLLKKVFFDRKSRLVMYSDAPSKEFSTHQTERGPQLAICWGDDAP